jgi:hypothetical protein
MHKVTSHATRFNTKKTETILPFVHTYTNPFVYAGVLCATLLHFCPVVGANSCNDDLALQLGTDVVFNFVRRG